MELPPHEAATLLREARALNEARAYPKLAELLEPWGRDALDADPELLFLRADVLRRVGRADDAVADLDALEGRIAPYGNVGLHRRRLNLLGSLRFEAGRIDDARDLWIAQLEAASAAGDEELAARACNNLGVVATLLDDLPSALVYYTRAVAAYQQVGYSRGLGQSHHNMGITYREMGFLHEADAHFRTADRLARAASSADEVARVAQERALLIYLLGDPALARHTAGDALERYERLKDPAGVAEVHRVLGLLALGDGRMGEALGEFDEAVSRAVDGSMPLLEAEARAARGVTREVVEHPGAEEDARRAREIFGALGAPSWGRRALDRARSFAARGSAAG